jgi:hypothetical protein
MMAIMRANAAVSLVLVLAAGCASQPAGAGPAVKTFPGPLVAAFPMLDGAVDVHWVSGTQGAAEDGRMPGPGPADQWLAGVVTLSADAVASVRDEFQCRAGGGEPDVEADLRPYLPESPEWSECVLPQSTARRSLHVDEATATAYARSTTS